MTRVARPAGPEPPVPESDADPSENGTSSTEVTPFRSRAAAPTSPDASSVPDASPALVPDASPVPIPVGSGVAVPTAAAPVPVGSPPGAPSPPDPLARRAPVRRGVRRLTDRVAAPYAVVGLGDDIPALLTRLYAVALRGRAMVHVVQLTDWRACDVGAEFVTSGRILGVSPGHRDDTPGLPPADGPEPRVAADGAPTVVSVRRPRLDGPAVRVLRTAEAAVLVVGTSTRPRVLSEATAMLEGLEVPLTGLVVVDGGIPRDPALG